MAIAIGSSPRSNGSKGEERKVAAILVADIVGYSRLTGVEEERTLARLRALRSDLIDPTIALHKGRLVKRTGDGAVVEFRSVVAAVRSAIEVQTGIAERNAGLPADKRIEVRVGIISATLSKRLTATSWVTASMSRPGCKQSASRAGFASLPPPTSRSATSCR